MDASLEPDLDAIAEVQKRTASLEHQFNILVRTPSYLKIASEAEKWTQKGQDVLDAGHAAGGREIMQTAYRLHLAALCNANRTAVGAHIIKARTFAERAGELRPKRVKDIIGHAQSYFMAARKARSLKVKLELYDLALFEAQEAIDELSYSVSDPLH